MGKAALNDEVVLKALEGAPDGMDMEALEATVGYGKEAIRAAIRRLQHGRKAYIKARQPVSHCNWKLIYAAGDHPDAVLKAEYQRQQPRRIGVPPICRAAFQAMPDNPFRVAMCQVGV